MIAETPSPLSRSCSMARLLRFAVAVSLVLWSGTAVLALPVAGTEASSPQPPTTNTTAQQQLSIAYTSEGRGTVGELVENEFRNSEILVIEITNGSLTLGPQSDTRIQVQDVTIGQTLTLTPTNNSKSVTLGTDERLGVAPEVAGDEPASISEFSLSGIEINTTASGDTEIFKTQKFSRFVVSVLAPDGSVVAQTEPALHGVFRPELTGEFNDTAVAIERPDDFNASWYVRGEAVGVSGLQLTNVEGADFFRAQEIPGEFSSLEESFTLEVYPSDPGLGGSGERISAPILDLTRVEGPVGARGAPGPVARFDADDDGEISLSEVQAAIRAFSNGDLSLQGVQQVIGAFSS